MPEARSSGMVDSKVLRLQGLYVLAFKMSGWESVLRSPAGVGFQLLGSVRVFFLNLTGRGLEYGLL